MPDPDFGLSRSTPAAQMAETQSFAGALALRT
jgi:hypothetical protein